jgi:hypothetical protein
MDVETAPIPDLTARLLDGDCCAGDPHPLLAFGFGRADLRLTRAGPVEDSA